MTLWRFDQGRLDYFQFDEIRRIARSLAEIDGIDRPTIENDILREALAKHSGRPFAPDNYTVWRNYKRVFGCLLLATDISGKIICTDLCKIIAADAGDIDIDDYLRHFSTNFYFPSPIFEGYNVNDKQVFPVLAVVKLLISEFLLKNKPVITTDDIANFLIANDVTGVEPLEYYANLKAKQFQGDLRQTRELIRFISQFSFLKWSNPNLYLEVTSNLNP